MSPLIFLWQELYPICSKILKDKNGTNYKDQGGEKNTGYINLTAMENNIGPRMIHQIPMCSFVPQHLENNLKYNYFHRGKKKECSHNLYLKRNLVKFNFLGGHIRNGIKLGRVSPTTLKIFPHEC